VAEHEISIRPGVAMLGLFPHMKYQPWYALGELVDNAIQSYLSNRDKLHDANPEGYRLRIEIEVDRKDGGLIVVRDNAAGIAHTDWERAFKVAEPPSDNSGLSQFGVGMKAACCWFSREWSLRTTHLGEQVIRSVEFDVPAIVASRDETLDVVEEPTDWRTHFTELRMSNLYRAPQTRTLDKIRTYLGGIYRQFLRNGDVDIVFNGLQVAYDEPPVLKAPRYNDRGGEPIEWRKDVDVRLSSGRRVTGFVGVREKGSTSQAGLALFYRNKVVTGSGEEMYKPEYIFGRSNSFSSQRVFGELHMDDFNVTYTKDALVWYDEEDEFLELLRTDLEAEPKPLLKQAENYRAREVTIPPKDVAGGMLDQIVQAFSAVEFDLEKVDAPADGEPVVLPIEGLQPEAVGGHEQATVEAVEVDRDFEVTTEGQKWDVSLRLIADEANQNWLTVHTNDGHDQITLSVNQAHPFMRAFCELPGQELEPVWRVAIALGLAQEQARLGGAKMPGLVVQKVNTLLRTVLSHKS
jgi:hypothetical protein